MTVIPPLLLIRSLGVGCLGGSIFFWLGLPLPWVLGAMAATIVAGAGGVQGYMPRPVRNAVIPLLGVTLGSAIDREALEYLPGLWLLLPITLAYLVVVIGCGCLYFTRVARLDLPTAYFASIPGSFSEMLFVAEERGVDLSAVAIVHSARLVVALTLITLGFRFGLGIDTTNIPAIGEGPLTPLDTVVLAASAVLGLFVGRQLRLPSAHLFGPLFLSAAAHLSGLVEAGPPDWMVALVQIFIGIFIGLRFAGLRMKEALPLMGLATVWGLLLLLFALGAAGTAVVLVDLPFEAAYLAFAPGGAAEISIIALAAGVSLSLIVVIQFVRMTLIIFLAPAAFSLLGRRWFGR